MNCRLHYGNVSVDLDVLLFGTRQCWGRLELEFSNIDGKSFSRLPSTVWLIKGTSGLTVVNEYESRGVELERFFPQALVVVKDWRSKMSTNSNEKNNSLSFFNKWSTVEPRYCELSVETRNSGSSKERMVHVNEWKENPSRIVLSSK